MTTTPTPTHVEDNEILSCFGNIIGTTSGSESDSGLYISDLEAITTIEGIIKGGLEIGDNTEEKVEQKMADSRRIAILKFHTDITTLIQTFAKPRAGFSGVVGSKKWDKIKVESGKSGGRFVVRPIKDAEIVLRGVNTLFIETGTIDIHIAANYTDDVETLTVDTTKNKLKINLFDTAIKLPTHKDGFSDYVEYYIYHENDMAFLNNRLSACPTCKSFSFNAEKPQFSNYGYKQYLNVAGFNGDPDDLGRKGENSTKGLQFILDVICRTDRAICNDSLDFKTNPMAMAYAAAIQYKAASVVIWDLLRTPDLNRVLMQSAESFKDAATYYDRMYNDKVKYLRKHMIINSDCFCEQSFSNIRTSQIAG